MAIHLKTVVSALSFEIRISVFTASLHDTVFYFSVMHFQFLVAQVVFFNIIANNIV